MRIVKLSKQVIEENRATGIILIVPFSFTDTDQNDISNYTIFSPFSTLHLIREAKINPARATFELSAGIYQRKITVLQEMDISE